MDITDVHMAILEPAGPPIGVDRRLFQDELPRMRVDRLTMQLDACHLIAAWGQVLIPTGHPHRRSSSCSYPAWFPMPAQLHLMAPLHHGACRGSGYGCSLTRSPSAGAGGGSDRLSAISKGDSPLSEAASAWGCLAWSRRAALFFCFCCRACSF